MMTEFFTN